MADIGIEAIAKNVMDSLPKANPNRVRELYGIEENAVEALTTMLNSSTPTANYEVRFIFSDSKQKYGIVHVRRLA